MKIVVTDANIFIDLIFLKLHGHLFLLDLEVHTTVEVFDATGRKIYTNKFFIACVLPSGNWQRGLYVVMVQTGEVFTRKKLLLE